jgi:UDP-N-acetylmuramate--alanine ligase
VTVPTAPTVGTAADPGLDTASRAEVDLSRPRRIHIVGVGGAGMSAIAWVLAAMGHRVSGSDLKAAAGLERLAAKGVRVAVGHDAANLGDAADAPELVAVSTAIPERNPEVRAARDRGIPVVRRAVILAAICATRRTLAVAGTHGKTTTSSMLALILVEAGLRPSFLIGGDLNEVGTGSVWDEGELLVVEADESDGTFLVLPAWGGVVTNVEADHLDHYGSAEALRDAFDRFTRSLPGPRVIGLDLPWGGELAARCRAAGTDVVTVGQSPDADYQLRDLKLARVGARFELVRRGERLGTIELPVPGAHNATNAAAATALALEAGAPFRAAQAALGRFAGVARRLQFRGERDGITFVDDYAHLPTEVAAALAAIRAGGWRRVVCVFQPHRYSRVAALWRDFADAFVDADQLVVTDVYPAGEAPRPGVSGKLIVDAVLDRHPWDAVGYLPRRADLVPFLRAALRPGDVCVTLGAGDLTSLPDDVLTDLADRGDR